MTDATPRIACAQCHKLMPSLGFSRCFTCEFGAAASQSSVKAREAIEAHKKRPEVNYGG